MPAPQHPALTRMTDITYSREYLRGIPGQLKQQEKRKAIQWMCGQVVTYVTHAAKNGNTSYLIAEETYRNKLTVSLTDEDIIYALEEKFPGCVVSFKELKRSILIDWS